MSGKVLGIIPVRRPSFARTIGETLYFTSDRVIVARTYSSGLKGMIPGVGVAITLKDARKAEKKAEGILELPEGILKAHKDNYAIPNSEITKVELKKYGKYGAKIHITTSKKKHKWYHLQYGETKEGKTIKLEFREYSSDLENILRQAFGDKLSVKK